MFKFKCILIASDSLPIMKQPIAEFSSERKYTKNLNKNIFSLQNLRIN